MKTKITLFITIFLTLQLNAQKIDATVIYNDGRSIRGNISRINQHPDFSKISPFIYFTSLFNGEFINPFDTSGGVVKDKLKIKLNGDSKNTKIPLETIDRVIVHPGAKKYSLLKNEEIIYKSVVGENLYKKKKAKKKLEMALLPVVTQGKLINTYGAIYPLRTLLHVGPFIFELTPPDAAGIVFVENKEKKTTISYGYIAEEKRMSARESRKRKEKNNHLNHNSLEVLFGDCPEAKKLIDDFYIGRIEDKSKRKELAKKYNKQLLANRKKFKEAIRKNRSNATVDLYTRLALFDLQGIIQAYEKNCSVIDEFDPRHKNYKKEYDLLNRDSISLETTSTNTP